MRDRDKEFMSLTLINGFPINIKNKEEYPMPNSTASHITSHSCFSSISPNNVLVL